MSARQVFEYLLNSLWQLPLLVLATWLVVRLVRPSLLAQHALWCAALALGVLLPLRGIDWTPNVTHTLPLLAGNGVAVLPGTASYTPVPSKPPIAAAVTALRVRPIHLNMRTVDWLISLYALSVAFSLARLVRGWIAVRRLAASAARHPLTSVEAALLRACAERLQLRADKIPEVRFLDDPTASPMVVGIRPPILLLPRTMRHGGVAVFDDSALAALLLHELAHVRRRDFLANAVAHLVALPIAYHPATAALQARIRQTREMICDSHAAGVLASKSKYARSLLALAERIVSPQQQVEAVGLFDHTRNSLEERIMKLTEPNLPLSLTLRAVRIAAGAAVLVAGTGTAATMHLKASLPVVYAMQVQQSAPTPTAEPAPSPQAATPNSAPTPAPVPAAPKASLPAPRPAPAHLNPEERKELDEQMVVVRDQMETLKLELKDIKPIVIPKIDLKVIESPQFEKQMAEIKIQLNSPEFRKRMDEFKQKFESGEFRKQMDEAAAQANKAAIDSGEFRKQMDEMNRRINSPEFQRQIQDAKKMALASVGDAAEARKGLDEASAAIAEARKAVQDENIQRKLDEAQRRIEEAKKRY